jgi:glycosyltransferase involved in cell wall biosynthesis
MRILFLSHYAIPHVGGIEVVIDALAREFRTRGHETVHVASDADSPEGAGEWEPNVIRVPAYNGFESRFGVPWPLFSPRLAPIVRREVARADVVHAHGFLYLSSVGGLVYARRRGRGADGPVRVLTEHVGHVTYDSPLVNGVERAAIATAGRAAVRSAEAVVVLNERIAADVHALSPSTPTSVIHNGVDPDAYRPPAPGERERLRAELGWDERPRALFVGRLVGKKGLDVALAGAAAGGGSFELVVIGPGTPPHAPPPHVTFMGSATRSRVAELYRAGDAFLLPSRDEGFPVTAQEAMASGLPVVLREDPSHAPWIAGAGAGVTLVPPDGDALAAAANALVGDRERHAAARAEALRHARSEFSWKRAADEHLELYASVLDRRRGARQAPA